MGEVGGKTKVANVCNLIIIQVKDSEVSAHGQITLKIEFKNETQKMKKKVIIKILWVIITTYNIFNVLAGKVEVGEFLQVLW